MIRLKALLIASLVGTIVPLEIFGLTHLSNTLTDSQQLAIAAPNKRPYRRASGFRRGVCRTTANQVLEELMAFLPDHGNEPDLSSTKAPTFYFYVPDQPENIANLEFRLDYASGAKRGNGVLNPPLNVPISKTPGIVKVQLPEILEQGTSYNWAFTLRCKEQREVVSFKGTTIYKPLDAKVTAQIAKVSSAQEKAKIYQQAGFVLDSVLLIMDDPKFQMKSLDEMISAIGFEKPPEKPAIQEVESSK